MEPIKQIFVAHKDCPPHYAYRGLVPKVGEQLDDNTVLVVEVQPHNSEQVIAIIGEMPSES